jgi:hypothetical protein
MKNNSLFASCTDFMCQKLKYSVPIYGTKSCSGQHEYTFITNTSTVYFRETQKISSTGLYNIQDVHQNAPRHLPANIKKYQLCA